MEKHWIEDINKVASCMIRTRKKRKTKQLKKMLRKKAGARTVFLSFIIPSVLIFFVNAFEKYVL